MDSHAPQSILQLKQCPACGYSLRGLNAPRKCPECGEDINPDLIDLPVWTDISKKHRNIVALFACGGIVLFICAWYFLGIKFSFLLLVLSYVAGTTAAQLWGYGQIKRRQPNALLVFRAHGLHLLDGKRIVTLIDYSDLWIERLNLGRRGKSLFRITNRRVFISRRAFDCTAFIDGEQASELLQEIESRIDRAGGTRKRKPFWHT